MLYNTARVDAAYLKQYYSDYNRLQEGSISADELILKPWLTLDRERGRERERESETESERDRDRSCFSTGSNLVCMFAEAMAQ